MPLTPSFEWEEDAHKIELKVPLKGHRASTVDLYASDVLIKINFGKYLLVLDLFDRIEDSKSIAKAKEGVLYISVPKKATAVWGRLTAEGDKNALRERREKSIEEKRKKDDEAATFKRRQKVEHERLSVRKQMALEEAERQRIEDLKNEEKRTAQENMMKTFAKLNGDQDTVMKSTLPDRESQNMTSEATSDETSSAQKSEKYGKFANLGGSDQFREQTRRDAGCLEIEQEEDVLEIGSDGKFDVLLSESKPITEHDGATLKSNLKSGQKGNAKDKKKVSWKDLEEKDTSPAIGMCVEESLEGNRDEMNSVKAKATTDLVSVDKVRASSSPTLSEEKNTPVGVAETSDDGIRGSKAVGTRSKDTNGDAEDCRGDGRPPLPSQSSRSTSPTTSFDNISAHDESETTPPPRPGPRNSKSSLVHIQFTPRLFPTPMRESTSAEEEDWLAKHHKHLKSHPSLRVRNDTDDISQSDPIWLKGKADDFYKSGDFQSAINAYSAALDIDPSMTACLGNRAACFLRTRQYKLCIDDCTAALDLLDKSAVLLSESVREETHSRPSSRKSTVDQKLKILLRRGTAYAKLGRFKQAVGDYSIAKTFFPANKEIEIDLLELQKRERCQNWKDEADQAFMEGKVQEAKLLYDRAIVELPQFVAALSNRAASKLALGDFLGAVEDCSSALNILKNPTTSAMENEVMHLSAINLSPSDEAQQHMWMARILARRASAYVKQNDYHKAIIDLEEAKKLAPEHPAVCSALANVQKLVAEPA